jgi:hypothetical protein
MFSGSRCSIDDKSPSQDGLAQRLRGDADPKKSSPGILPVLPVTELLEARLLFSSVSSADCVDRGATSIGQSNVVLIDSNLPDSALLARATLAGDKVFTFDGANESVEGILGGVFAWAKTQGTRIRSLSLLSHGTQGAFEFGDSWISNNTINQSAQSWKQLGEVLAPSAEIDIYSCNVAAPGGQGQELIDRIARMTGATLYASDNLTGKGGDWILEVESETPAGQPSSNTARVFKLAELAAYPDTLATLSVATPASASPSPVTGTTTNLSVLGASTGGENTLSYTWLATTAPAAVTYTANGTNASKNTTATFTKKGSYTFKVTISDGVSTSVTSIVSVTVNQTLTTTTVTGSAATIHERATKTLTAKGYDQFGASLTVQPTFTWSIVSGAGSVSAAGVFTSGGIAGSPVVQASSAGIAGTFTVTVTNAAPTVATAAAINPKPAAGTTAALSVLGADDNTEPNLIYTWAATVKPAGSNPTFSINGTNAAKNCTVTFNENGNYTFVATISDGQGGTKTSTVTETVNQTLTSITVTPGVATLNEGNTQHFAASGLDQFGNVMGVQPAFTWSVNGGGAGGTVSGTGLYTAPAATTGTDVVKATSAAVSGTANITVSASSLPATASPSVVTGTTTTLSALASGDTGQPALTYTWSAIGSPPVPVTFSVNGTNAAKNSIATFVQSGTYTIQVSIVNGTTTTSSTTVTVNQTLTSISISPAAPSLNLNQTQTFSASGLDQFGIAMVSQPTFTWSMDNGSAGTFNTGTQLYSSGTIAGTATIRASSGGVAASDLMTVIDAPPTVATAAAANPATVTASTTNLTVLGADDGGEANLIYTWSTTGSPPAPVTFSDGGDNAAKNVTATFTAAGSYNLLATIDDGTSTTTSAVTVVVAQTITTITVSPASGSLGAAGTQQFTATGYDQFATAMASQPTFSWSATSGSIDVNGMYTAPLVSATPTITASSGGISGTATATVTNAAPTVATAASATPGTVTGTTTSLSVLGADDGGESNLIYTWATTGTPPAAVSFSANGTNAAKNATATFTQAGSYSFQVTITDAGGLTTTSSVAATVNQTLTSLTVTPATASLNLNASQTFTAVGYDQFGNALSSQPTFTWSKMSGVGSINNSTGVYSSAAIAGSAVVQATSGSVNGAASVTVTNAAPTVATAASASPSPVTGTTAALSVLGADDGGESNLTYTWATTGTPPAPVTFSVNGTNAAKASTVTFNLAGNYNFTVSIFDGTNTTTSAVSVTVNQTLTTIGVTPSPVTLPENSTQQFTAVGYDQFSTAMLGQPTFTWSKSSGVGSINSSGLYIAPGSGHSGSASIVATSGSVSGTASITVSNNAPTVATAASASSNPVTAAATSLSVLGADDGGESNLTYTWAATTQPSGANPVFSANGTNAAKASAVTFNKAGNYIFQVTITDVEGATATSSVNLTVNQTLTTITASPSSASLNLNASQTFTAVGYDQFGNALSSQPTFTWSKMSGVGSINSSTGVYSSAATPGSAVVQATSGSVNGAASVTVTNAAPTVATAASATPGTVSATTSMLSVLGADDGGESNLTYTWATTGTPPAAVSFSANGTNAAKNATATFTKVGNYSFQVTITDTGGLTTTSNVSVTVNQTLSSITVAPTSANINENATQSFSATAYDQFGTAMAVQPAFTWSNSGIGSINSSTGLYTAPGAAGSATVAATSAAVSGNATVTVTNAVPTVAVAAGDNVAGGVSVIGIDSATQGTWQGVYGTEGYSIEALTPSLPAGDTANFSGSNPYTWAPNTADPRAPQNLGGGRIASCWYSAGSFTADLNLTDGRAHVLSLYVLDWDTNARNERIDILNATGTTVLATQTVANFNGGKYVKFQVSGHVQVKVTNVAGGSNAVLSAMFFDPPVVTGASTNLSVLGADDGGESNLSYTWSTTGSPPAAVSFSANGTNAAKNTTATFTKPGAYSLLATITDSGGLSTTSSVTVNVSSTLSSIAVTPANLTLGENTNQQFSATGYDQFGTVLAAQPAFTWTATTGVVGSTGYFTSPATPGTITVTAANGSVSGNATVTVNNAPPTVAVGITNTINTGVTYDGTDTTTLGAWQGTYGSQGSSIATLTSSLPPGITMSVSGSSPYVWAANTADTRALQNPGGGRIASCWYSGSNFTIDLNLGAGTAHKVSLYVLDWDALSRVDQIDVLDATGTTVLATQTVSNFSGGKYVSFDLSGHVKIKFTSAGPVNAVLSGLFVDNTAITYPPPAAVNGTTSNLAVLGTDDNGESNLTYTWATTGTPPAAVSFSANGTNASKNTVATFTKAGVYSVLATITDSGGLSTTSSATVTVNQTFTSVVVTPGTSNLDLNGSQQFSATGYDQFGNVLTTQPTFTWAVTAGGGSVNSSGVYTAPSNVGTATVQASFGGINGTSTVNISDAAPTVATAAAASANPVTGTTAALSVLGADDGGESNLTYTWSTTGTPPATVVFSVNGTNAAKNTTATFTQAGVYSFLATLIDAQGLSVTSATTVTVSQTMSSITVTPGTSTINENGTQALAAVAYDQFGIAMASQPTFTWSKSAGIGSVNSSNGVYTAPGLAGTATVTATSGSITGTASVTVNNASPTVVIAATASPSPINGSTTALSVLGADDNGEANLTYTWAATAKPVGANPLFSVNSTNAAKDSTVTFDAAGNYTFTVTISDGQGGSVNSSVSVTVNQTLTAITVTPGTANINENATQSFTATGVDQFGIAMASQPTFTWSKSAGIGSVNSGSGVYTAPGSSGTASVTATSGSITGTASVTISNAAPTVAAAAAADPSPVSGSNTALSVLGADDNGEANLTYSWAATTKPAGSNPAFSANGNNTAKNSTVTFDRAGNYTFTATISDGQGGSVTSSVNVAVNQTLTSIAITPASASLNENATQSLAATGYDQFGIAMASQPTFTWSKSAGIGSVNSSTGLYMAPGAAGVATITAASGSVTATASMTVSNATPTVATAAVATPSPVNGTTAALSVLGADDNGEANLTYTWSASTQPVGANPLFSVNASNAAKNSTVSFDKAGSYTFIAAIDDGQGGSISSSVSVTVNQTLTTITLAPGTANLNENATQSFAATGYDQFGIAMASQPAFSWSKTTGIGSVDSGGVYTAPGAAGTATIAATSGSITGTAGVTVTNASPTVVTAAAASPSPVNGSTTTLSVMAADDGGEANLTYTWSASTKPTGSNPLFGINGSNAAKNSTVTFDNAGNYTFTVTINDGQGGSVTSSVSVTVNQTLTSITITPGTANLNEDATQSFAATAYDQFGIPMISQPVFTWSKSAGIGSVNNGTGLYTAPGTSGVATITATSGSISGSASVTVSNASPIVVTAAAATPSPVNGSTTALSVLGADDNGEANLTYTWAATAKPVGANPLFSVNGTNVAKDSTVTFDAAGNYTFTVTINDGQGGTVNSSVSVTVNQTLTSITITPGMASLYENATQNFTAIGFDQFSNTMASQPIFTWSKNAGIGSIDGITGLYTAPGASGTATIIATSGSITGMASVTVTNASPTVAIAAAASPSPISGTTTGLSVLGADDNGEANLAYTWMASTKPSGSNPTFSANGTNASKNITVIFDFAGNYTFIVTISDGQGGIVTSSVSVTVNQTLSSIGVNPPSAAINENSTQSFTATGYDQFGALMVSQPSFAWSKSAGIGSIDSSTGVYTSPGISGAATIAATSNSISGVVTITVTNAAPRVAIAAAASPSPASGVTTSLSVLGADDGGESNLIYTWTATTTPAGANPTFSMNGTNSSKASTVTFDTAGNYIFTVTISDGQGGSVTSSASVPVNQTLSSIIVTPAAATINENGTQPFAATAYDQFGLAMASQPVFTWSKSAGIGSVNSSSGVYTAPGISGTATITATSGSTTGSGSVVVSNAAPTVATAPAASPSPVNGSTTALSVLGADDNGESNLTYTWTTTSLPAGSNPTFSANGTNAAKNSTVTFDEAGNYTFTVTINDGQGGTVTSSVNVTVNQTLTSIAVLPGAANLTENAIQNFAATGYDQFAIAMASQPTFTWSKSAGIGSVNGSTGVYTAPGTSGIATIVATSGSVMGTANVTVSNASPTVAIAAAASPSSVSGTTTRLSVLGADDNGESNLTYTWTATGSPAGSNPTFSANGTNAAKNCTATFNAAGNYTFLVTINDGQGGSVTSSVGVIVNQTLTSIAITPGASNLNENAAQSFAAIGYDQFGNAMVSQPTISWSNSGVGSIDGSTGIYTAPGTSGAATINATSGSVTGTASVIVSNETPTVATAAAASPSPVNGSTTALSVLGADDNGEPNLTYTWTVSSKPAGGNPIFSANGTNAAKDSTVTFDTAGSYTFTAIISDGQGGSVTSSVSVTVDQTLTTITITPGTVTINENAAQSFAATGYDQFGSAMATQPTFTWSKSAGIGSVDINSGLYTSPGTSGTATINASSGPIAGTANIVVSNAAPTVAVAAAASPSAVNGLTTALSVLGADDNGESNLTYIWTVSSKPAGSNPTFNANGTNSSKDSTATFDAAGNYTFVVIISDGQGGSVTSSVGVMVNQTLTSIALNPVSATINENSTQPFAAVGYDQFSTPMLSQPTFTWSKSGGIGSVDINSGVYTSPGTSGTVTIAATSGLITGSANVTVANATPTVATAAAASPSPINGLTTALSVLGADDNGEANLNYSWSVSSKPAGSSPAFSANGNNAAKNSTVTFDQSGDYSFTVTISDGQGGSVASSVSVTVNQTLTSITIAPGTVNLTENAVQSFAASGYDQFGIAMASQPAFTWSKSAGIGSVNSSSGVYTAPSNSGTATITATSGSITGTASVTVSNASPTIATAAAASPSPVIGLTTALSVLGADDNGESNLTYTWTTSSKPAGSNPTFSANGTNGSKISTVTFDAAGNYTFDVTISDGQGGSVTSSVSVTVNQTLASIRVSPPATAVNENSTQLFTAAGYDQFGTAMVSQPTFSWSNSGIGAVDSSTGIYTAPVASGAATISATSGSIAGTASITVNNAAPTVATAAAASPSPVNGLTTALSVLGADDGGEANLTYSWTATTKPGGATSLFSANGTNAAKNNSVTFNQAGNYTFTVTISDGQGGTATSSVSVTVNQTLTTLVLTPGSLSLNENATQNFAATGYDQFGILMAISPLFTWTRMGIGSVDGNTGVYTAPGNSGTAIITATSGSVTGAGTVTVSNASPTVAIAAAVSPSPSAGTTSALSVLGADDNGESNLTYTWAIASKPAGSNPTFSANGTNAAKNSTATFDAAGNYSFVVTISDGQGGSVTSSVSMTVDQTLTRIVVSPASSAVNENATVHFVAAGFDQFTNAMTTAPTFSWSKIGIGSIDSASGDYSSPGNSGAATIIATSGSVTGNAGVTVINGAPTVVTSASASPSPTTGTTTTLSVLGADDGGESNLIYTWAATGEPSGANLVFNINGSNAAQNTTVTFDKAGDYTFIVTIADGQGGNVTSSVSMTVNQTLSRIVLTPGSATVPINGVQQMSATGYDQFGAVMASQPLFAWSVVTGNGAIDSTGRYTAPSGIETDTLSASVSGVSGQASVVVYNGSAATANPATVAGLSTTLAVSGTPASGLTYTWTIASKPNGATDPLFRANASSAAQSTTATFAASGDYVFNVAISNGITTTIDSVNVTVEATPTTLRVMPGSATIDQSGTLQLAATMYDQFGIAMAIQPAFTWAIGSGVGSINAVTGIYSAGAVAGNATVRASNGNVNGTATVAVNDNGMAIAAFSSTPVMTPQWLKPTEIASVIAKLTEESSTNAAPAHWSAVGLRTLPMPAIWIDPSNGEPAEPAIATLGAGKPAAAPSGAAAPESTDIATDLNPRVSAESVANALAADPLLDAEPSMDQLDEATDANPNSSHAPQNQDLTPSILEATEEVAEAQNATPPAIGRGVSGQGAPGNKAPQDIPSAQNAAKTVAVRSTLAAKSAPVATPPKATTLLWRFIKTSATGGIAIGATALVGYLVTAIKTAGIRSVTIVKPPGNTINSRSKFGRGRRAK